MTTTVIILIIAFIVFLFIEKRYKPRLDITRTKDVYLWYNYHYFNHPNRKWFISRQSVFLFKLN